MHLGLALAGRLGIERSKLDVRRPRCGEIGFDASRRRMTTIHRVDDGYWVAVKGALGALLDRVHPDDADALGRARKAADDLAENGYRTWRWLSAGSTLCPTISASWRRNCGLWAW